MTKLQVLIATYGQEGLGRISARRLPEIEGVGYLVSCQTPEGTPAIPASLIRDDLKVIFSPTRGLSKNRNILLRESSAPYCLIADDDLDFIPAGLQAIIEAFDKSPGLDIIALQYSNQGGETKIKYPDAPFDLDRPPKGYFISSVELAFRRESIIKERIFFNENFGVGSKYPCGEEDLWLHDGLHQGLKGEYRPAMIAVHYGLSTGIRNMGDPLVLRAQGAVISRLNPRSGFLRVILKAWRASRSSGTGFMKCLIPALSGWKDYILHSASLFNNNISNHSNSSTE